MFLFGIFCFLFPLAIKSIFNLKTSKKRIAVIYFACFLTGFILIYSDVTSPYETETRMILTSDINQYYNFYKDDNKIYLIERTIQTPKRIGTLYNLKVRTKIIKTYENIEELGCEK